MGHRAASSFTLRGDHLSLPAAAGVSARERGKFVAHCLPPAAVIVSPPPSGGSGSNKRNVTAQRKRLIIV